MTLTPTAQTMTAPAPPLAAKHPFPFSAERVFDAWLDSTTARQFLFATAGGEMIRANIDARVGGNFEFVDRRNGEDIAHTGTYLEIDRPRRIKFKFAVNGSPYTNVSIDIATTAGGCELTLTHEGVPPEMTERSAAGWTKILRAQHDVMLLSS